LQRLGYLLEKILGKQSLANALFNAMAANNVSLFKTPLKSSASSKGFPADEKWKVIVNIQITPDQ
jgi:hypothetical protein